MDLQLKFLEDNFLTKNLNNKTYLFVNCAKSKKSLDYEKLGSKLYLYLKNNKIDNSFINADKNSLTNVQLEKLLHGVQLKSYNFQIYKSKLQYSRENIHIYKSKPL